jgi:hypothetical protein
MSINNNQEANNGNGSDHAGCQYQQHDNKPLASFEKEYFN